MRAEDCQFASLPTLCKGESPCTGWTYAMPNMLLSITVFIIITHHVSHS